MKRILITASLVATLCIPASAKSQQEAINEAAALEQQAIACNDWYRAAQLYQKASKIQGLPAATRQYCMGRAAFCYLNQNHFAEAAPMVKELAEAGNLAMMGMYGEMLYSGLGVRQNMEQGIAWLRKAARLGNREAQKNLRSRGLGY